MDKNDFDLDYEFDFEKEYGFDPKEFMSSALMTSWTRMTGSLLMK